MGVLVKCAYCGKDSEKHPNEVNRAKRKNAPMFCDKDCFGLSRRLHKTVEKKKLEKKLYDQKYRAKNLDRIKANKRAYFQRTYDPEKAAVERKKNMARHVEYCRRPEYRAKKRDYDKVYRAKQEAGEFWESYLLIQEIEKEIYSRMSWYEIHRENGQLNKATKRRIEYEKSYCK
jgi:hypothetical protein